MVISKSDSIATSTCNRRPLETGGDRGTSMGSMEGHQGVDPSAIEKTSKLRCQQQGSGCVQVSWVLWSGQNLCYCMFFHVIPGFCWPKTSEVIDILAEQSQCGHYWNTGCWCLVKVQKSIYFRLIQSEYFPHYAWLFQNLMRPLKSSRLTISQSSKMTINHFYSHTSFQEQWISMSIKQLQFDIEVANILINWLWSCYLVEDKSLLVSRRETPQWFLGETPQWFLAGWAVAEREEDWPWPWRDLGWWITHD